MNKKINKKSQVMLEFLMTYGWVFLVILIMLGVLTYFGVLDTDSFIVDEQEYECVYSGIILDINYTSIQQNGCTNNLDLSRCVLEKESETLICEVMRLKSRKKVE